MSKNPLKLLLALGLLIPCNCAFSQITVDFDVNTTGKCVPLKVVFINKSSDTTDYTFKWDMDESQITQSLKDSVSALYLIAGKKTITLTAYDKLGAVAGQKVKQNYIDVHADPVVKPLASKDSTCIGNTINFQPIIVSSDTTIASWIWDYGDGSPYGLTQNTSYAYSSPGNYQATVFATDANGCTTTTMESKKIPIVINQFRPIANFTMSDSLTCDSILFVKFTNASTFAQGKITGYKWYFGNDTSIVKNPTYTFTRTSVYDGVNVNLYVSGDDGCTSNPMMKDVILYNLSPKIFIKDTIKGKDSVSSAAMACTGKITIKAAGNLPDVFKYQWNVNGKIINGYTFNDSIITGATIPISLTVTNPACSVTVSRVLHVEPPMSISITPNGHFFCENTSQSFGFTKDKGVPTLNVTPKEIQWWVGNILFSTTTDASASTLPYLFKHNATYDMSVKVTSVNQCHDSVSYPGNILVYAPKIDINRGPVNQGCAPITMYFLNKSSFSTPSKNDYIKTVTWDFGDGSPIVQNADTTAKSMLAIDSVVHTYKNAITSKATLTITTAGGCTLDTTRFVRVGAKQTVKYTLPDTIFCANPGVVFHNLSTDPALVDSVVVSYDATNDGHAGLAGNYSTTKPMNAINVNFHDNTGTNTPGYYDLTAQAFYNGCNDSLPVPHAVFVKGPLVSIDTSIVHRCSDPYNVTLKVKNMFATDSFKWEIKRIEHGTLVLKNTIQMTNPVVCNFDTLGNGTYCAILIGKSDTCACTDTAFRYFVVNKMIADISVTDTTPCMKTAKSITFGKMNTSYLTSFKWQVTNPKGVVDTGGLISPHRSNIVFDELGLDTTNHIWLRNHIFDDQHFPLTSISDDDETFALRGVYTFQATATDINSCTNTVVKKIRAYLPVANYTSDTVTSCLPFQLTFKDSSTSVRPIVARHWYTHGKTDSTLAGNKLTVTDTYTDKKTYPVILAAIDDYGCVDSVVKSNAVVPVTPIAKFTLPYTQVCEDTVATFKIDTALGMPYTNKVDSFVWHFGDGTTKTIKNPLLTYTVTHKYNIEEDSIPVIVHSYVTSPSGKVCQNADSSHMLSVKKAYASFELIQDSISCVVGFVEISTSYTAKLLALNWWETYGDTTIYRGNKAMLDIPFQGGGVHKFTMITSSIYTGCRTDSTSKSYIIPQSLFKITAHPDTVCINQDIQFTLSDTNNIARYSHIWYFKDGTKDSVNFNVTHSYANVFDTLKQVTFLVTKDAAHSNCADQQTKNVYVRSLMANFNRGLNDSLVKGCDPFTVDFHDESSGDNIYSWNFGDGSTATTKNPVHTFTVAGKIRDVTLSVSDGMCDDNLTKAVQTVDSLPHSSIAPICQDSTLTITLLPPSNNSISVVSWQPSPSIVSISPDLLTAKVKPGATADYFVTYKSGSISCTSDFKVKVQQRPVYDGAPNHFLVYVQDNDTLKNAAKNQLYAYVNYSLNNDSIAGIKYTWKPATGLNCTYCANPLVNIDSNITYIVTMADSMGCFVILDTIPLKVIFLSNIGLPTAFTPNKDGANDIVIPRGWGVKEFLKIEIYNRWGELVYKSSDMEKGWDGTFNGKPQDPDTYAWLISFIDVNNKTQAKKGYITLLR